jgi:hypothetical protein
MLMVWILTGLAVSCTRKMIQVPVHPAVAPTGTRSGNGTAAQDAIKATDDSSDLANQLRDPDLLNRLDDPSAANSGNAPQKPGGGKPVIIKGSDLPPAPITPPQTTPQPPLGKPELPNGKE